MLHVHATSEKNVAELILEDIKHGNNFFFLSIAFTKKISYLKLENRGNYVKKFLSILILW